MVSCQRSKTSKGSSTSFNMSNHGEFVVNQAGQRWNLINKINRSRARMNYERIVYMFVCLSVCLPACLPARLPICLSDAIKSFSRSLTLFVRLSICVCLCVSVSVCLFIRSCVCLPVCPFLLHVSLFVHLSVPRNLCSMVHLTVGVRTNH